MRIVRLAMVGAALAGIVAVCSAQNPFFGRNEFPQFRQISGLSGGGYGLDLDGWGSLSGATAFSTPLGIALGHDQVRLGADVTQFSLNHLSGSFSNNRYGSSKAFFTYGHSFGDELSVAYSYFVKSYRGDASTDLQVSYKPKGQDQVSISAGVQDIVGDGGSAGANIPGDTDTSRSIFGAITTHVPLGNNPLYLTGGWGSRRFDKGFASSSYQIIGPFRLWTEYDGFGFNEGILLAGRVHNTTEEGGPAHGFEANLMLGFIRGRYPTAALTLGF